MSQASKVKEDPSIQKSPPKAPAANASPADTSLAEQITNAQKKLKEQAKELTKLASCFTPLTKPATHLDLLKLQAQIDKASTKVNALKHDSVREHGKKLIRRCQEHTEQRKARIEKRLGAQLRELCAAEDLSLKVVSREDPIELRIHPFAIVINRDQGNAELRFARCKVSECPADANAIIQEHKACKKRLNSVFSPKKFFEACYRAWLACKAIASDKSNERVEILDFLPFLALQLQKNTFKQEPTTANYKGYSRAQFAYDVQRLKQDKQLSQNGLRLNLGVATGNSASDKKRVIWFEDGHGEGEYKLTVFFTKVKD